MSRLPKHLLELSVEIYRALLVVYPPSYRQANEQLVLQMFRDICRENCESSGVLNLITFWSWILFDLGTSASIAHLAVVKEGIMKLYQTIKPVSWGQVLLVVIPGVLLGISRVYYPLGFLARFSFFIVGFLALAWLAFQKRLPAWGLLALGNMISSLLLGVGSSVMTELAAMRVDVSVRELLVSIPVWILIFILTWKSDLSRHIPTWTRILFIFIVGVCTAFLGPSVLVIVGVMVLPFALGLPLAQRHGSLASLFVLGAFSVWLFDSDFYYGPLLMDRAFYPLYVLLMALLFVSIAPLLLLRAQSQRGQGVGLLAPILFSLILGVAVPWLVFQDSRPLRVWLGNTGLALFALFILSLAYSTYLKARLQETPESSPGILQPLSTG
jgi:hypothetical protein